MRSVINYRFLTLILVAAVLCACGESDVDSTSSKAPAAQTIAKPGKISFGEEIMADFDIPISKNIENPDGSRTVEAIGEIDGKYAGFKADISPNIDRVKISSLGKVSDNFLNELAEKYEHKTNSFVMNSETEFVCINIGKEKQFHDMKLFYGTEGDDASKYAELYLNIDEKRNVLEFHEKDPDYREAILKALTKT